MIQAERRNIDHDPLKAWLETSGQGPPISGQDRDFVDRELRQMPLDVALVICEEVELLVTKELAEKEGKTKLAEYFWWRTLIRGFRQKHFQRIGRDQRSREYLRQSARREVAIELHLPTQPPN
jgi:hypothetical protein